MPTRSLASRVPFQVEHPKFAARRDAFRQPFDLGQFRLAKVGADAGANIHRHADLQVYRRVSEVVGSVGFHVETAVGSVDGDFHAVGNGFEVFGAGGPDGFVNRDHRRSFRNPRHLDVAQWVLDTDERAGFQMKLLFARLRVSPAVQRSWSGGRRLLPSRCGLSR